MVRKGRENDSGRGKRMCKGPGVREAQQEKGSKGDWYEGAQTTGEAGRHGRCATRDVSRTSLLRVS